MAELDNLAITGFRWGQIIDAKGRIFKDARLFPGGVEAWDWSKTGTRHEPGVQAADFADLLATKPDVVILSRGVDLVLLVSEPVISFAQLHVATVLVLQSQQAVTEYNRRIKSEHVVALIHSTC